ncbi:hypothetical protein [Streptococcus mutans]|uniref:hypothetical protein n=1 Tax=Streptococcus mutans TaxID=1309 RepID=UPI0002B5BE26|nr:hypothetical protein [Streptococcus mutans]EMC57922.1 hypothetical protein SMU108_04193 [Streptococcus mutans M230]NLQ77792.1 hypothetical protein [Streptococcus mutans]NLQ94960.1 hypothetical protein [Streptococcus mutans]
MTKPKLIAAFCAVLYFIQAFLHFLILLGLPLGGFFFGGLYTVFPFWLRPANFFFALIWSFFAYFYLIYGQILPSRWSKAKLNLVMVTMTGLSLLATVFNLFISSSPLEKYGTGSMTALTFLLSCCLLVLSKKSR